MFFGHTAILNFITLPHLLSMRNVPLITKLLFIGGLVASCSMNRPVEQWENQVLGAQSQLDRGDDSALQTLYKSKEDAPDRARERWVSLVIAQTELRRQNQAAAIPLLEALHSTDDIDEHGANAHYLSASLKRDENPKQWHEDLVKTILRYPNEIAAERALEDIIRFHESEGTFDLLEAQLQEIYPKVRESLIADNVLFARAQNSDQNLKAFDNAIASYALIWSEHRAQALADDAIWEIAQLQVRLQMWRPAIHNLAILAESGESSWFVGSYDSPFVSDSMLELGHIYVHLGEYENAWHWFHRFAKDYDDSIRAPYATWLAAECLRLQKLDAEHLHAMRELMTTYPDSKWAAWAESRLGPGETP